ncbi:hypothetical protein DLAC_10178 [Tieghemostelium lacteum]|uniref:Uncharacterized protein n=1 Tax=Tieghemostelium lacteum TaxID=361077 RepID=A0A151Z6C2_TIELA|nr:hypothetical protein DLAC_10178 [Tieghemostelium lacteum]|eukprot:KYQ89502.1 hypothetical protein DLAC_10178 [Tieghemostelium lacteum]
MVNNKRNLSTHDGKKNRVKKLKQVVEVDDSDESDDEKTETVSNEINQKTLDNIKGKQIEEAKEIIRQMYENPKLANEMNGISMNSSIKEAVKSNKNYFHLNSNSLFLPRLDPPENPVNPVNPLVNTPVSLVAQSTPTEPLSAKQVLEKSLFQKLNTPYRSRTVVMLKDLLVEIESWYVEKILDLKNELRFKESIETNDALKLNSDQLKYLLNNMHKN